VNVAVELLAAVRIL